MKITVIYQYQHTNASWGLEIQIYSVCHSLSVFDPLHMYLIVIFIVLIRHHKVTLKSPGPACGNRSAHRR